MNIGWSKRYRRLIAFLMIICMVFSNSGFMAAVTEAEEAKVSEEGQQNISKSKDVSSDTKSLVNCKLEFVVGSDKNTETLNGLAVSVKDENGSNVIMPEESGNYLLIPKQEYQYSISNQGIKEDFKTGTFTVSSDNDEGVQKITVPVELIEPSFTIDGQDSKEITQLKKDSTVSLVCTNYDELYKKEKWKCILSEDEKAGLENAISIECTGDSFNINYEYGKYKSTVFSSPVTTFSDYNLKAFYKLADQKSIELVNPKFEISKKDVQSGENQIINQTDMESGAGYEVTVSVTGFEDITVLVTPNSYERDIEIKAGKMVVPQIKTTIEKKSYCGGEILLNDVEIDETDCYPNRGKQWNWDWECVKEGDSNKKLLIKKTDDKIEKIDLKDAEEGIYKLTCGYNDIRSVSFIKVTVSKLKLDIDLGKMPVTEKIYDGTPQFKIEISIKDNPAIVLDNKNKYDISDNDKIEITCNAESADVGKYSVIKDVKVSISKNDEKYDTSAIKEKLEGKAVNLGSKKLIIKKAIIEVENPEIVLQYRSKIIDLEKTNKNMKERNSEWVDTDLNALFGEVILKDESTGYCDFENLNHIKNEEKIVIENENAQYSFIGLQEDEETEYRMFQWEYTSEIIQDKDIADKIKLIQNKSAPSTETVNRKNMGWCNENNITAEIISSEYKDNDAYDMVTFIKMQNIKNNEDLKKQDIAQDNGKAGAPELIISGIKERTYYKMMFTRKEPGWKYSSVAAIVCVISEDEADENEEYSETIIDEAKREYPVITLFVDSNPAEINFNEEELERDQSGKKIVPGSYISKIGFKVKNNGFALESIHYSFCKFDPKNKIIKVDDISIPKLEDYVHIPLEENNKYTIDCPDDDGDYVLYLKLRNTDGREDVYISNGMFVDTVPPDIQAVFKTGESDITESVTEGEFYTNQAVKAEFTIDEPHLQSVEVTVTAEEKDGESIEIIGVRDIEDALEQSLKGDEQTAEYEFTESANYIITINASDKANNIKGKTYKFTVDHEKPDKGVVLAEGSYHNIKTDESKGTGKIELVFQKLEEMWENLNNIIFSKFSQEEIKVTLEGNDRLSPFSLYYYITESVMSEGQLEDIDDEDWIKYSEDGDKGPKITVNKKDIVYGKVIDQAGNISYFCSEGMITDNKAPEVKISVNKEANKNNFYHDDIPFSAFIEDKIADGGTESSGLQYVSYRIEADDKNVDSKVILDSRVHKDFTKKNCDIQEGIIKADKFNKNNIKLYVTAVDNAGNKEEVLKKFSIDTVKPEISVTYNDEQGSKYYNSKRTATVMIRERNLDTKDVKISVKSAHGSKASIGKWSHSANAGKSDDATHTCKITFSEDDDYEFSVNCVDMAGNKAAKKFSDTFTLDTTVPVISVSYNGRNPEQNAYYNEAITATITIKEHNFNAGKVNIQTHASGTNSSGVQGVSGFSSNGDIHTATIPYNTDGIYGLNVTYTDEAGNQAVPFNGNTFTIDITEPELTISNVEDKSANKDEVKPIVTCTDTNYDKERVSITVRGVNSGEVDLEDIGYAVSDITDGQQFVMDFPKTEERDDVYILTAKMEDRAGNEKESSIEFSVNRYGSVYTLGTETGEWMINGECAYVKEGKPVVIIETNVDEVVEQNISYTAGGMDASTVKIPEAGKCSAEEKKNGTYFEASALNGNSQWYQYRYEINAENFEEEGRYTIQIDSTDKAGNHTSNVSNRHTDSNLQVQFAVDQTAPNAVISGAQNGEVYNEEEHTVLLDVQDNLAINQVTVYLNDQEYGTYSPKDIAKMEDGLIPVVVGQSITTQKIQIKAVDMAGNILSRDADGTYDKVFDDFRIIVTRNVFVRFLHTPWLLLLVLFIIACITGGTILIIMKKKKAKEET